MTCLLCPQGAKETCGGNKSEVFTEQRKNRQLMDDVPQGILSRWKKILYRNRFLFLLVSILSLMLLSPLLQPMIAISLLVDGFFSAIFVFGIYAVSSKKRHLFIAALLAFPVLVSMWTGRFTEIPIWASMGRYTAVVLLGYNLIAILSYVMKQKKITAEVIYGAIVVYLLIGLVWSVIYSIIENASPGSFNGRLEAGGDNRIHFLYFSYVTLTTLGYGDVTPVTDVASSFCIVEAVVGQLYIAVTIARLVGVHVAQSSTPDSDSG